ncbi:MAG: coenzyme F420-0:L-glutamate ligase [Anaerolineae bacterium]|nr:coenzyme F420-0:L-glutamate ligase [Anaerolineae bacterium]
MRADFAQLSLAALPNMPLVRPGDDLAALIVASLHEAEIALDAHDVLVVTSKLVSKAEGRFFDLNAVTPSTRAAEIAAQTGKDPRLVELILRESSAVSRLRADVLIVRHRLGFTLANAGIDHSNVGPDGEDWVLLLPEDPDASARRLRAALAERTGVAPGIVISDSHGRPFRLGTVGVAIGLAGIPALADMRGARDLFGRTLRVTVTGLADEIAAAAGLLSGQGAESRPVVLVRGLTLPPVESTAAELVRPPELDLYR